MRGRAGAMAGLIALILPWASPVAAQSLAVPGGRNDTPIEITAERGIEWQQQSQAYVARGNARAVQGDVTVESDTLTAFYRKDGESSTRIWRLDADGNVRIRSPDETARGDKAVYDVEKEVLVLTGRNLQLDTQDARITARDSIEYWRARNMAVARGDAVAIRGKDRLRADILTAHFRTDAKPKGKTKGKAASTGQLRRIDAFDNVLVSTPDEIVRARKGVYNVSTGIVTVSGAVKITRGKNQLNGEYGEVNLNTGISRLLGTGKTPVRGMVTPTRPDKAPPAGRPQ